MTAATTRGTTGVVLMSYGSPEAPEDVPAYLSSVRRGRAATEDLVAEFQRRYRVIGSSPLLRITLQQASALESLLNAEARPGESYLVTVGMRHAPPWISDAFTQLASHGVRRAVAVILSPQYSPIIMGGYLEAVDQAMSALGPDASVQTAGAWHMMPSFIDALAVRAQEALDRLPTEERDDVPVVFTAHSMPKRVIDQEPGYIDQLKETASAVAGRVELTPERWQFAYQSAGHTPEEWLRPDIKELFPDISRAGHRNVLVAPVQFLADHLEVLYVIDVAARQEAEEAGLTLMRTESFNVMPEFIRALADVVWRELGG